LSAKHENANERKLVFIINKISVHAFGLYIMKINEILNESQNLEEGPIGNVVGKVGRGIGKAIGGVAKAAGAVSGAVQGAKTAFAKGKQAATDVVGGTGQGADAPAEPANQPSSAPTAAVPSAQQINKAGPKGSAMAKQPSGIAAQAIQKTAQAIAGQPTDQAGQTLYAQVKSQINQLDKKGKQRILNLLQKSLQQTPAQPAVSAQPAATPKRGQPVKVSGTQQPQVARLLQPKTQNAGKVDSRPAINESFTLYRKR
jgi:hypothetical protein